MSEAEFSNQQSRSGNTSRNSTKRVARLRQRRRNGVLFVCDVEVYQSDLTVLKSAGYLRSADPKAVSRAEFEDAIAGLLYGLARRLGIIPGISGAPPTTGG